jgi:hypothetical protein
MTQILEDVKDEALRVIDAAQQEGMFLRLIGGLAVWLHSASAVAGPLSRAYKDADYVTDKDGSVRLPDFFARMGYSPNKTFNTLSGDRRQLYYDLDHNRQVDVFISDFAMCHKIPLAGRLHADARTIPLAELFLTKTQIVEINSKDVLDLLALLLDHDVGPSDEDMINSARVAELTSKDWGLYTTTTINMDVLKERVHTVGLDQRAERRILDRLMTLQEAMQAAPKPTGWKLRNRIGMRLRWYDLPEEVQRT